MEIIFNHDDLNDRHQKGHASLIVQLTIGNCLTKRILINGGNSDVIFLDTPKAMGIDKSEIIRRTTTLVEFNSNVKNKI